MIYYETGEEIPEILGSGSSYHNVVITKNENEAIQEFSNSKIRNYLWKIENNRPIAYWDKKEKRWINY